MIEAPNPLWATKFNETIVPETFVEISMGVIDTSATSSATIEVGKNFTDFNDTVLGSNEIVNAPNYATLEENLWTLDGSKIIRWDVSARDAGYVGNHESSGSSHYFKVNLPEVTEVTIPGFMIVWSNDHEEYPTDFGVTFANSVTGGTFTIVFQDGDYVQTIQNGLEMYVDSCDTRDSHIFRVSGEFTGYDSMRIDIGEWNTPNHRKRLDRVVLGYNWTFTKKDILSYTHEQTGDLLGAELPKNSITFTLDNSDDKWNPNNPDGFAKFVVERQMVKVRYGMDVDSNGHAHWISAGTFYLAEWDAPSNGLEATFTARDPFEFMMSVPYSGLGSGNSAWAVVQSALSLCEFPNKLKVRLVDGWDTELAVGNLGKPVNGVYNCSVAEMLQMCACIMHCVMWFDRNGTLQMVSKPWNYTTDQVFDIPLDLAYSYPEVSLSKPIKYVTIRCTNTAGEVDAKLLTEQCEYGETQSFELLMVNEGVVNNIFADFIKPVVKYREQITGEYRADPRLDVFDLVNVETKYGDMLMVLTGIKYTYTGSFHAEYTARKVNVVEETLLEGDVTEVEI